MKIIKNDYLPFEGYKAMNFFGILFHRNGTKPLSDIDIRHEEIHSAQMKELLYVPFYILYVLEWMGRLIYFGDSRMAYRSISFEQEAYEHETEETYLSTRKHWAQWRG